MIPNIGMCFLEIKQDYQRDKDWSLVAGGIHKIGLKWEKIGEKIIISRGNTLSQILGSMFLRGQNKVTEDKDKVHIVPRSLHSIDEGK